MNNKPLKPSTRCIDNLGESNFTKTGMSPEEHARWEKDTEDKIKKMHDEIDRVDNPPEQMTQAEIDLWIQENTLS